MNSSGLMSGSVRSNHAPWMSACAILSAFLISACDLPAPSAYELAGSPELPFARFVDGGDTVSGVVWLFQNEFVLSDSGSVPGSNNQNGASAQFLDEEWRVCGAGTVLVDGRAMSVGPDSLVYQDSTSSIYVFDGEEYEVDISGGSYPAFTGTIATPVDRTHISSPSFGDPISRSSGMTVTWNVGTADTVRLALFDRDTFGGATAWDTLIANDGSHTIPSSVLSTLDTGTTSVGVFRCNYTTLNQTATRKLLLVAFTAQFIDVELGP